MGLGIYLFWGHESKRRGLGTGPRVVKGQVHKREIALCPLPNPTHDLEPGHPCRPPVAIEIAVLDPT